MQSNNFDITLLVYDGGAGAKEENGVFAVEKNKPYLLRIANNNERRAVGKVFVNNELVTPEGVLLPAKNFLDITSPKFVVGTDKQRIRVELHFEVQVVGGFNIDIHVPLFGPGYHHHPHPYYPPPPPPYYPYPPPYYPPPPPPYYPYRQGEGQGQEQPTPPVRTMAVQYENNVTVVEFDVVGG
jgi:hypothetical protein